MGGNFSRPGDECLDLLGTLYYFPKEVISSAQYRRRRILDT